MKLAITGFVSNEAGSGPCAHVLIIRELLKRGHEIHFFSKPSFVDPRPLIEALFLHDLPNFRFIDVTNTIPDQLRESLKDIPIVRCFAERLDSTTYNRLLVKTIDSYHAVENYDLCIWMGDYVKGKIKGLPSICGYGPIPGTDARSILRQYEEVKRLAGPINALKWKFLANLRLSKLGFPRLDLADHTFVLSEMSKQTIHKLCGIDPIKMSIISMPIDLDLFNLCDRPNITKSDDPLRICWAGRIVPRKRLDLFLDGAALAIKKGINLQLTILGDVKLVSGYEKLIENFPFRNNIIWIRSGCPRNRMPAIYHSNDVLVQPSEEEDFGSSPAEAQACGCPVIVGQINGNADYLCERDIHLTDYKPETLCNAYIEMSKRKKNGTLGDPIISRKCAEQHYDIDKITTFFISKLENIKKEMRDDTILTTVPRSFFCRFYSEFPL